jgi:paraquat-inducible protein B
MAKSANPVAVGAFVLGTVILGLLLVVFFSGGHWLTSREHYVLVYDRSIKGLNVGAPVTIKGVKIGEVVEIKARMYSDSLTVLNTVVVEIEPDTLELEGDGNKHGAELMDELINRGLCAQLRLQSLLTGLLYVDVDFRPDKMAQFEKVPLQYKQIPTVPTDLEQLTRDLEAIDINKLGENLQQIVDGVNKLVNDNSLQHLGGNVEQTLVAVRASADQVKATAVNFETLLKPLAEHSDQVMTELNRSLPQVLAKLDDSLGAMRDTAAALKQTAANTTYLTSEDSPLIYRIDTAAAALNGAADQVRHLTDLLEQQPESLLYGKMGEK